MTEENKIMEFGSRVGQVIRFFNRKGYGFIRDLNDDKDYFVHNSDINISLEKIFVLLIDFLVGKRKIK